jgi:hypothetical protein
MADRNLREQGHAFQQRFGSIESKQRAMALRAWPGAVRSEKSISTFVPSDLAANQVVSTLSIPSGRWLVHAQGTVGTTDIDTDSAQYIIGLYAWDAEGNQYPDNTFDLPTAYLYLPANPTGEAQYSTVSIMGDVISDEVLTIGMAIQGTAARFYNFIRPRLRCLPV